MPTGCGKSGCSMRASIKATEGSSRLMRKIGLLHAREHKGDGRILKVNVVHQDIGFGDSVLADRDYFGMRAIHPNPLIAIFAENHRLAVFEIEHFVLSHAALSKVIESAVVKDVAVLIDLDER